MTGSGKVSMLMANNNNRKWESERAQGRHSIMTGSAHNCLVQPQKHKSDHLHRVCHETFCRFFFLIELIYQQPSKYQYIHYINMIKCVQSIKYMILVLLFIHPHETCRTQMKNIVVNQCNCIYKVYTQSVIRCIILIY
jgi:hypothetical protein